MTQGPPPGDERAGFVARLADWVRFVAGALLVTVALAMTATIAGRYVGFPTAWADETARIAFVWSVCFGAASGIHRGMHFAVQLIIQKPGAPGRRITETVIALVMLAMCVVVLYATSLSIPVASKARLPALGISGAWMQSAMAVFCVLSAVFIVDKLLRSWRTPAQSSL